MKSFSVTTKWQLGHEVVVGPIEGAAERLADLAGGTRLPLVTDERILDLWGERLGRIIDVEPLLVPEGEAAKSWPVLQSLIDGLTAMGATRSTPVIALGGGSVGDVAGLAAALFKRGCPIVHLPTSLLAQVDSAIGGKTAIDSAGQKNLVGAFHAPALVVADPSFLATLDARQLRSGYAEMVKYGLIEDEDFFAWCEAHGVGVIEGDEAARLQGIEYCLRAKSRFVAGDFHDRTGRRALLNFGHTFGHAIEAVAGIGSVFHGEAVALGMQLAFQLSVELNLCPPEDEQRVRAHFASTGLPGSLADCGLEGRGNELLGLMLADKKAESGRPVLILTCGIGQAFVSRDISAERLSRFLDSL